MNSEQLPKRNNLEFEPESHTYTIDGRIVPSVSQIMKPLTEGTYARIPKRILDKAKDRGTKVHEAIENYIIFGTISEECRGYVEQFIEFLHQTQFQPYRTELMLTEGTYAGTVDLLLMSSEGVILVDLKTTYKIHEDLLGVQLAGYKTLCEINGYNILSCHVLQLKPDKFKFQPIEPNNEKWRSLLSEHPNKIHQH